MGKIKCLKLKDVSIFSEIDIESISFNCNILKKHYMKKGEVLLNQGEKINRIFFIGEGSFKLVRVTENGDEVIIRILRPGEVIGETSLFRDNICSPVTVIVLEDAKLCSIERKSFEKIITGSPEIALKIIQDLSALLYFNWERVAEWSTKTTPEKIINLFFQLAQEHGEFCTEGIVIKIYLTQQEIASAVGVSRVMVSRALQELIRNEYISRREKFYILKKDV